MSGDAPQMSKRILNETGTIAVELVLHRLQNFRFFRHGLFDNLVAIGDVHVQAYRRPTDAGRADVTLAHFWIFVREHEARVADLQLRMADLSIGAIHTHDFGCAKNILAILDRSGSVLDDEVGSNRVVSLGNVMDFAHNFLLDNEVEGWGLRRA